MLAYLRVANYFSFHKSGIKQIDGLSTNVLAAAFIVYKFLLGNVRTSVQRFARSSYTARTAILLSVYQQHVQ